MLLISLHYFNVQPGALLVTVFDYLTLCEGLGLGLDLDQKGLVLVLVLVLENF